ncbi:hypothetical protein LX36DRAFT_75647 [Colletotrichum falcatum]|nr:hypothetical protein LX36DRAFT_75647 [Colletotrichum falcatum]
MHLPGPSGAKQEKEHLSIPVWILFLFPFSLIQGVRYVQDEAAAAPSPGEDYEATPTRQWRACMYLGSHQLARLINTTPSTSSTSASASAIATTTSAGSSDATDAG